MWWEFCEEEEGQGQFSCVISCLIKFASDWTVWIDAFSEHMGAGLRKKIRNKNLGEAYFVRLFLKWLNCVFIYVYEVLNNFLMLLDVCCMIKLISRFVTVCREEGKGSMEGSNFIEVVYLTEPKQPFLLCAFVKWKENSYSLW
jgi:hypothetical protein